MPSSTSSLDSSALMDMEAEENGSSGRVARLVLHPGLLAVHGMDKDAFFRRVGVEVQHSAPGFPSRSHNGNESSTEPRAASSSGGDPGPGAQPQSTSSAAVGSSGAVWSSAPSSSVGSSALVEDVDQSLFPRSQLHLRLPREVETNIVSFLSAFLGRPKPIFVALAERFKRAAENFVGASSRPAWGRSSAADPARYFDAFVALSGDRPVISPIDVPDSSCSSSGEPADRRSLAFVIALMASAEHALAQNSVFPENMDWHNIRLSDADAKSWRALFRDYFAGLLGMWGRRALRNGVEDLLGMAWVGKKPVVGKMTVRMSSEVEVGEVDGSDEDGNAAISRERTVRDDERPASSSSSRLLRRTSVIDGGRSASSSSSTVFPKRSAKKNPRSKKSGRSGRSSRVINVKRRRLPRSDNPRVEPDQTIARTPTTPQESSQTFEQQIFLGYSTNSLFELPFPQPGSLYQFIDTSSVWFGANGETVSEGVERALTDLETTIVRYHNLPLKPGSHATEVATCLKLALMQLSK